MKRDMDLVRDILLKVEEAPGSISYSELVTSKHGMQVVAYHVEIMSEGGLLDARTDYLFGARGRFAADGTVLGLTWAGHDYLAAVRNEGVWNRTKKVVSETVGDATLDVIKALAVKCLGELMGV